MDVLFHTERYEELLAEVHKLSYIDVAEAKLWFRAAYALGNLEECRQAVRRFEYISLDDETVGLLWKLPALCQQKGHMIVGSTDPEYVPQDKECVIYYGAYPITWKQFCAEPQSFCNAMFYDRVVHDKFVSGSDWLDIDRIFIVNMKTRTDRKSEVLSELARVSAPLDRIEFMFAYPGSNTPLMDCTLNHYKAMSTMKSNAYTNCLFLEDDVVFSGVPQFAELFRRQYTFDIVFLATSRWWRREPFDDLLIRSYQGCTTSSSYLLTKQTLHVVMACVLEGIEIMRSGGPTHDGAIDCHWRCLHPRNQMFVFKNKPCYQRPGWSNIVNAVSGHYD